jgi:DNA primase (bacterial type)
MNALVDTAMIAAAHPLPSVVGAVIPLETAGNEWRGCCPFHNDGSPSLYIYKGGHRWYCFGCGKGGDVIDFVRELHRVDFRRAASMLTAGDMPTVSLAPIDKPQRPKEERIEEARAIWRAASPAPGTLVETYLRSRGLDVAIPGTIRFAQLKYGRRGPQRPCLVAVITGPDNRLCGIQRTYLATDGLGKAKVAKPKLSLGQVSGGAIRLAPAANELVVCEGLEDGLTIQQEHGRAVWVAAGAGNMAKMQFPQLVSRVIVGGDADEAGLKGAEEARKAFASRHLAARVIFPARAKDFNAELMEVRR